MLVKIFHDENPTQLPTSIPYGGLSLWGGVVAFASLEEYQSSAIWNFLDIPVDIPSNKKNGIVLASIDTKEFIKTYKKNQRLLSNSNQYNVINMNISKFEYKNDSVYLYDYYGNKIAKKYDKLVLCLESIQTPNILHSSGYIDKKINVHDNTMKLVTKWKKPQLKDIYDYSNKRPQFVSNNCEKGKNHHYVKVLNRYKFNSVKLFNEAYWIASGKNHLYKIYAGIKVIFPGMIANKFVFSPSLQDNIFKIQGGDSANNTLEFNENSSNIFWSSKDKYSVSAFHFHNSINHETEIELKKKVSLYLIHL